MTDLNRRWTWLRACPQWIDYLAVSAVVVGIVLAASTIARAAPLTYAFEAEVVAVRELKDGVALPFSISIGDTIEATLTIETEESGTFNEQTKAVRYEQSNGITYHVDRVSLSSASYSVFVRDDSPFGIPVVGSIANPTSLIIHDDQGPAGPNDDISIRSGVNILPTTETVSWSDSVVLAGDSELLSSNDLNEAVGIWNRFSFREMALVFVNSQNGAETYVGAVIGSVRPIPEPATGCLTIFGCIAIALATIRASCMKRFDQATPYFSRSSNRRVRSKYGER